jgi:large subunit ribosomal protein L17
MRHRVAHRKLGRTTSHRTALLRNLAVAFFDNERIRTTLPKAKELRPYAEKLITLARREDGRLHARRLAAREIQNPIILKKLFDTLGPRFQARNGGYSRIYRLGPRRGDGTEMAMLELVGSEYKPEKKDEKGKAATSKDKDVKDEKAEKATASKKEAAPKKKADKAGAAEKPKGAKKTREAAAD